MIDSVFFHTHIRIVRGISTHWTLNFRYHFGKILPFSLTRCRTNNLLRDDLSSTTASLTICTERALVCALVLCCTFVDWCLVGGLWTTLIGWRGFGLRFSGEEWRFVGEKCWYSPRICASVLWIGIGWGAGPDLGSFGAGWLSGSSSADVAYSFRNNCWRCCSRTRLMTVLTCQWLHRLEQVRV